MKQFFLFVALLVVLYVGFALLALSQDRHWQAVRPPVPLPRTSIGILRTAGYALIVLGLLIALLREGPSFGPLLWCVLISVAALAVTATISWRPHWLKPLAWIAIPLHQGDVSSQPSRREKTRSRHL